MMPFCMQGELDELEREEFFRLKKVQGKKHSDAQARQNLAFMCIQQLPVLSRLAAPLCLGSSR